METFEKAKIRDPFFFSLFSICFHYKFRSFVFITQCKSQTFLVLHMGNYLFARRAHLCCLPMCVLVLFGELPIIYCKMSSITPLFTPICCLQLMDHVSTSFVNFSALKPYNFFFRYTTCCIQFSTTKPIEGS